jgi:2-polyprenyl-3-methyl-5-hydroxy-6-metoxy-1,4-benzoquinol methylase
MNLAHRSYTPELLDRTDIPFEDIKRNMLELEVINSRLGGHKISIQGLRTIIQNQEANAGRHWEICEVGCGGGDNLLALFRWCSAHNISASFTGIDINPHCIEFARSKPVNRDINFIISDYHDVVFTKNPDIIFCSLFCHHFKESDLVEMLQWFYKHSNAGFFINDLHRHAVAWYSIKMLTTVFSNSYLVKNDAPLSVARGFKRNEWQSILNEAGISTYQLNWRWAFRWLITVRK